MKKIMLTVYCTDEAKIEARRLLYGLVAISGVKAFDISERDFEGDTGNFTALSDKIENETKLKDK